MQNFKRACYAGIALVAFVIGLIGIIVPGLPGVLFMLIAAWAAAKGHPAFHKWLRENKHFGHHVCAWEDTRTMPKKAKLYAVGGLCTAGAFGCLWLSGWALGVYIGVLLVVMGIIWKIPSTRADFTK